MTTTTSVLPARWEVPEEFSLRLGDQAGRQRAMLSKGHLLLVLHAPPAEGEAKREGRYFWRNPEGVWSGSAFGGGVKGLRMHVNEYAEHVDRYEQHEEQATRAEDYFAILNGLAPVARAIRHLHEALQDARKMCPEERELIFLRDRAYEIVRAADLLYAETKNGLDFAMARRAEEQAASSHQMAVSAHRLNVLAAFFFPLATLSAIFGVNLAHGLEEVPPPTPFLCVLAGGLIAGIVLKSFVTRPKTPTS